MKYLIFFLVFLTASKLSAQDKPADFKIYDSKKKKQIALADIIADMKKADVLFFGEEHDDSIGHVLEAETFKQLNVAYPQQVALSMEMFQTDIQTVLDEYLAGLISEKNLINDGRAWSNYVDYKPLINYAKENKLPVIAANAAARYSNAVTKNGLAVLNQFSGGAKNFFAPLPIDTATGRYYEKFTALLGGHGMGSMKVYQAQNFWDATMAYFISKFIKTHPKTKVLHLNGRFHSDEKLGTLAKLKQYAPNLNVLNISSFSDESFEQPNWEKFKDLGDYIIITNPKLKRSF